MSVAVRRTTPWDELVALPPHLTGEILAGQLHVSPRPAPRHAVTSSALGADLLVRWQLGRGGPGGWLILDEPELHLGEDVLVPDLAGWRRETLPALPETAFFATRPDWACEVLSPSNALRDRSVKLPIYAARGVPWAWLVDPDARSVEVFRLAEGSWVLHVVAGDDAEVGLPPFEATPLALGALWSPPPAG